jgi:hypothetical protein
MYFKISGVEGINNQFHISNKADNVLENTYILDLIDIVEYVVYALYSRFILANVISKSNQNFRS